MMKKTITGRFWAALSVFTALALSTTACSQAGSSSSAQPAGYTGPAVQAGTPWSFGIMADTQWTVADDGNNPNTSAISIIKQVDQQFIAKGVKLVVAVGDLADNTAGTDASALVNENVRATFAQDLYNAGIGFFPLRGNHDDYAPVAAEFVKNFPQTQTGVMNQTPSSAFGVQTADPNVIPGGVIGQPFTLGSNFTSPTNATNDLNGLSYAFNYQNATFVLLDQFTPADQVDGTENPVPAQQSWISSTLSGRPANTHAFVFAHKGIITEDHTDVLFGTIGSDPTDENAFIQSLQANKVHYFIGGHDHMHDHTIVNTSDATATTPASAHVTELVCASDSSKFYTPAIPSNDQAAATTNKTLTRQTAISQELYTIGYYIVTINGSQVTVDFYSAPLGDSFNGGTIDSTPPLNFTKRETFGYNLNGKEFVVAQGAAYTSVTDSYTGSAGATATTVKLLGGVNQNTSRDYSERPQSLAVDTGWTTKTPGLYSDIVTLTGLAYKLGSIYTDPIPVAVSFTGTPTSTTGGFGLLRLDPTGTKWINAIEGNNGGNANFVYRAWNLNDTLGTYGIDNTTTPPTAWAVVNQAGTFAVGPITQ